MFHTGSIRSLELSVEYAEHSIEPIIIYRIGKSLLITRKIYSKSK